MSILSPTLSICRYNAIIRPLSPRMSRPTTILIAVAIWIVGMLIALPQLLYFTTQEFEGSFGVGDPMRLPFCDWRTDFIKICPPADINYDTTTNFLNCHNFSAEWRGKLLPRMARWRHQPQRLGIYVSADTKRAWDHVLLPFRPNDLSATHFRLSDYRL